MKYEVAISMPDNSRLSIDMTPLSLSFACEFDCEDKQCHYLEGIRHCMLSRLTTLSLIRNVHIGFRKMANVADSYNGNNNFRLRNSTKEAF